MKENKHASSGAEGHRRLLGLLSAGLTLLVAFAVFVGSTVAWFAMRYSLASYAPITRPEALYIGAGHRDYNATTHRFTDDHFESIRYLYLNGIDVAEGREYYDYVFCVFGSYVAAYRLQLAYTTNNQFSYEIFHANEASVNSDGAVAYTTHGATPTTYYYTANGAAIAGGFLNDRVVGSEVLADSTEHVRTYDSYNNVNKYGEPLYWQTTGTEQGQRYNDFINYYILRVKINGKLNNDRETDVICIAAKSGF